MEKENSAGCTKGISYRSNLGNNPPVASAALLYTVPTVSITAEN